MAILTWAFYRAWNSTGAPLFLAIVIAVWTALLGDALWAFLAARRPRLSFEAPSLCQVGESYHLTFDEARPTGALLTLNKAHGGDSVRLGAGVDPLASLGYRGLLLAHFGELTVHGPLGLVACRRRFTLANGRRQFVGPVPDLDAVLPELGSAQESEQSQRRSVGNELTRSIRQYRRGDSRQHVAWKVSARSGELLVREFEGLVDEEVTIVAEIRRHDDEASELAMGRAAGYAINAISAGVVVKLVTNHADLATTATLPRPATFGKVTLGRVAIDAHPLKAVVRSEADVLKRLAAAVPSKNLLQQLEVEAFYVSSTGDRWESR
ncbi:MAG: DUF58 domain-containing protein [Acidimicrobiales bacterium]